MTMLNDDCFMRCLHSKVEYLKSCNMSLLIDPCNIINKEQEVWNDAMANLNSDETGVSKTKNLTATIKKNKSLLKCGFVITGRPKKVWALNLPSATIESDENNENWYQLGKDMMITKYEELSKHHSKVQYALEYGK